MEYIDVSGLRKTLDLTKYVRRPAAETDYSRLITTPTTLIEDGHPLLVYEELGDALDSGPLCAALNDVEFRPDQRSSNLPTTSRTFGHQPRNTVRRDYCSTAAMAREAPRAHALLCDFATVATQRYLAEAPDVYTRHLTVSDEHVRPEYRIEDTPFTSGIVNKNNPLLYHFDGGNDKDVWSAMFVFRNKVEGGFLAVPEFDMAFALPHNSLFMFDGQKLLHGVTPLRRGRGGWRYSVVFYSRREMWNCLPLDEELARIRNLRTTRERTPRTAERIGHGRSPKKGAPQG